MKLKPWMSHKRHQLKQLIKHEPKRFAVYIIGFNALFQLALSQIHIESLVKVKLTVSTLGASNYTSGMPSIGIGMFNFLFILFGLATIFNSSRATEPKKIYVAIGSILLTLFFGFVYLLKIINPDNIVRFSDVSKSLYLMASAILLYIAGGIFLIFELIKPKKE